jgi:hypothetical protein
MAEERKKLTIPALKEAKKVGRKIAMASIPDYLSAVWAERAADGARLLGVDNFPTPSTVTR